MKEYVKCSFEVYVRSDNISRKDKNIIVNVTLNEREDRLNVCKYKYNIVSGWMFKKNSKLRFLKESLRITKEEWEKINNGDILILFKDKVID